MKLVIATALTLSLLAAGAASARPMMDHHRHKVCSMHHHHKVCRWAR
jgi:hypothetical protein